MNEYIIKLRSALKEELDATNTYDRLLAIVPEEDKAIIEEIKKDEINHQGRLLQLVLKQAPGELDSFNKGLEQED